MNYNRSHVNKLVSLVLSTSLSYNEDAKAEFHRLGRLVCKEIAKALELPTGTFDIRSNKGGIAVSGEVMLHSDSLYLQLSEGVDFGDGRKFMFRYCNGRKDYSGGANRWMRWDHLMNDFEDAIREIKLAVENKW